MSWSVSKSSVNSDDENNHQKEQRDEKEDDIELNTSNASSNTPGSINWRSTFSPYPMILSSSKSSSTTNNKTKTTSSPPKLIHDHHHTTHTNKVSQSTADFPTRTPKSMKAKHGHHSSHHNPSVSAGFSPFPSSIHGGYTSSIFSPHASINVLPMTPYSNNNNTFTPIPTAHQGQAHNGGRNAHERVRNLRGNVSIGRQLQMYGGGNSSTAYQSSMASPLIAHPAGSYYNNTTRPTKCYSLKHPLPGKFQGDMERNKSRTVPDFTSLINFPSSGGSSAASKAACNSNGGSISKICVMCGKLCPVSQGKKNKASSAYIKNGNNTQAPIIPSQNKGLCTACDVSVWCVGRVVTVSRCECVVFWAWARCRDVAMSRSVHMRSALPTCTRPLRTYNVHDLDGRQ